MPDQTRLLVVDDDADIRELLSAYLARYDMTVETAADGAGLFEKLDHAHFDLIILDIMLPGRRRPQPVPPPSGNLGDPGHFPDLAGQLHGSGRRA